jgi:hypothetical protein
MADYSFGKTLVPKGLIPAAERLVAGMLQQPQPDPSVEVFLAACRTGDMDSVISYDEKTYIKLFSRGLDEAASAAQANVVQHLLSRGAQQSPLTISKALESGSVATLDVLSQHGWKPDQTSLIPAAAKESSLRWLLDHNVPTTASALARAAIEGSIPCVDLLLNRGVKLQASIALHSAAQANQVDMVAHLIKLGADVNQLDEAHVDPLYSWGTPLHHCVMRGAVDTASYLLESGADPTIQNRLGSTALDVAKAQRNDLLIQLLEDI